MFKVIAKTLIILLVIAALGTGMYFLVQNSSSGTAVSGRDFGNRTFDGQLPTSQSSGQTFVRDGFGDGGHEGRNDLSVGQGLTGILGNLIEIALITLAVVAVRPVLKPARLSRPAASD
jgi:hypothetical protein